MVYMFTDVLNMILNDGLELKLPEGFEEKHLGRFREESWVLTEFNNGNGLSFAEIDAILNANKEVLEERFSNDPFAAQVPQRTRDHLQETGHTEDLTKMYLAYNRNHQRGHACVYAVMKDTYVKTLVFRLLWFWMDAPKLILSVYGSPMMHFWFRFVSFHFV